MGRGLGLAADAAVSVAPARVSASIRRVSLVVLAPLPVVLLAAAVDAAAPARPAAAKALLAEAEGVHLTYYGNFAGMAWPTSGDLASCDLRGVTRPVPEVAFEGLLADGAEWFAVTSLDELRSQPDLTGGGNVWR